MGGGQGMDKSKVVMDEEWEAFAILLILQSKTTSYLWSDEGMAEVIKLFRAEGLQYDKNNSREKALRVQEERNERLSTVYDRVVHYRKGSA